MESAGDEKKNFACYFSPREIYRPVLVAIVEREADLSDQFWELDHPIAVYPHGIYFIERTNQMKRDPKNLFNPDGTMPADATLEREAVLLNEQSGDHPSGWVAQRLAAIISHLGRVPQGTAIPEGHPRKIPNRRLP